MYAFCSLLSHLIFLTISFKNTIRLLNRLNSYQTQCSVEEDLGPNYFKGCQQRTLLGKELIGTIFCISVDQCVRAIPIILYYQICQRR